MSAIQSAAKKVLFPLSSKYNENWIKKNSLGENVLYNLESLCEVIEFEPGMKVLDLGCGKAISAIFLANEYKVRVYAGDNFISPTENYKRILEQNCEDSVLALKLDARHLPFPAEYFDRIIIVDSYMYFGTDEKYTKYISQFLKPGGVLGIVDVCYAKEITYLSDVPEQLREFYQNNLYHIHSVNWWVNFWSKTGLLKIEAAELLPNNEFIKNEYLADSCKSNKSDPIAQMINRDESDFINFFRLIGRRTDKKIINGDYAPKI